MVAVEIQIISQDNLAHMMTRMREWLDGRRVEPSSFRYIFAPPDILMRIDFSAEDEADAFANAFDGRVVLSAAAPAPARQSLDAVAEG